MPGQSTISVPGRRWRGRGRSWSRLTAWDIQLFGLATCQNTHGGMDLWWDRATPACWGFLEVCNGASTCCLQLSGCKSISSNAIQIWHLAHFRSTVLQKSAGTSWPVRDILHADQTAARPDLELEVGGVLRKIVTPSPSSWLYRGPRQLPIRHSQTALGMSYRHRNTCMRCAGR